MLRRYYRTLFIPTRDGLKEGDLGVPTYGATKKLDEIVYENLRSSGEILERIAPLLLKERYLRNNEAVSTDRLYQSSANSPGSLRVVNRSVWESGICEGVKQGIFGLGEFQDGKPVCRYFKEPPPLLAFTRNEIIIREEICVTQKDEREKKGQPQGSSGAAYPPGRVTPDTVVERPGTDGTTTPSILPPTSPSRRKRVSLKFTVPQGRVSSLLGMMNFLQSNFNTLQIELTATDGEMSEQEYEDKIKEGLDQLGVDAVDE